MLRAAGSALGWIFTTGPRKTNVQSGRALASAAYQVDVEALVEDAEEPDPRMRQSGLILRIRLRRAGARKVRHVDAARKGVHTRMPVALALVQALSPREHEVGTRHQLLLASA